MKALLHKLSCQIVPLLYSITPDKAVDEKSTDVVNPTEYSPDQNNYDPIKHACWKHGEK